MGRLWAIGFGLVSVLTHCASYSGVGRDAAGALVVTGQISYLVVSVPAVWRCALRGETLHCARLSIEATDAGEVADMVARQASAATGPRPAAVREPVAKAAPPAEPIAPPRESAAPQPPAPASQPVADPNVKADYAEIKGRVAAVLGPALAQCLAAAPSFVGALRVRTAAHTDGKLGLTRIVDPPNGGSAALKTCVAEAAQAARFQAYQGRAVDVDVEVQRE